MNGTINFFPRYIDRPRLIGIFEMDEFFVFFGSVTGIIALSIAMPSLSSLQTMLGAITTGGVNAVLYKRFKKNRPVGHTLHTFYKKGIWHPQDTKIPNKPYLKKIRVVPYGFTKTLWN
jgi:hypothetical protein